MQIQREIKVMYDAERLPSDIESAMTHPELHAFREHRDAFGRLANAAARADIGSYLSRIADQDAFWIMLYSTDESPFRVYFHHTIVEANKSFEVRLPCADALPTHVPEILRPVYSSFGGIRETYNGLRCPEDIVPIENAGWLSDENELDPNGSFVFYETGAFLNQ